MQQDTDINRTTPPLDRDQLLALAPTSLSSNRQTRYDGREVSVSLKAFDESAQRVIQQAYAVVQKLQDLLRPIYRDEDLARRELERFVRIEGWKSPFSELARLHVSTDSPQEIALGKIAHDLKGGALAALYGLLQLVQSGSTMPEDVTQCYFLARDHAKIMRNGLPDLDPERYEADLDYKLHDVELLAQKWRGERVRDDGAKIAIHADIRYDGAIATRCMEFSALDRVLYNLLNNAVSHTSGETVFMSAIAVPEDRPTNLRFVIANAIDAPQRRAIAAQVDGKPSRLFDSGVTTGSTGLGLAICTEFIAHAYGLAETNEALEKNYLGASIIDDHFVAWAHWPLVDD